MSNFTLVRLDSSGGGLAVSVTAPLLIWAQSLTFKASEGREGYLMIRGKTLTFLGSVTTQKRYHPPSRSNNTLLPQMFTRVKKCKPAGITTYNTDFQISLWIHSISFSKKNTFSSLLFL